MIVCLCVSAVMGFDFVVVVVLMCHFSIGAGQVKSVPQLTELREDTRDASVKQNSFSVFSAEGHREQFRHGQGRPVSDVIHRAFPPVTTTSPSLLTALQDDRKTGLSCCVTCRDQLRVTCRDQLRLGCRVA